MPLFAIAAGGSSGSKDVVYATLGGLALLLRPSSGHWYAHDGVNSGQVLRLVGIATAVVAVAVDPPCVVECRGETSKIALTGVLVGLGASPSACAVSRVL